MIDTQDGIIVSDYREGRLWLLDAETGDISVFAGNGSLEISGDGGLAVNAGLGTGPKPLGKDMNGNIFIVSGNFIRKIDVSTMIIEKIAGNGNYEYSGDGGLATEAGLDNPKSLDFDQYGNMYVSTYGRIRKIDVNTGIISTVAGNGNGFMNDGDGGLAKNASIGYPIITLDENDNILLADNNTIRKIDATSGIIDYYAGGNEGDSPSGTAMHNARFNSIRKIVFDSQNQLIIIDGNNHKIKKIENQFVFRIAGIGTDYGLASEGSLANESKLHIPRGLAANNSGELIVADNGNNRIIKIDSENLIYNAVGGGFSDPTDGISANEVRLYSPNSVFLNEVDELFFSSAYIVSKIDKAENRLYIVGGSIGNIGGSNGDGGLATEATLGSFIYSRMDKEGNIYISEFLQNRIRKIDVSTGIISTIGGTGEGGFSGDGGLAINAKIYRPTDLDFDNNGDVFFFDSGNNRIRKIDKQTGIIETIAGTGEYEYNGDNLLALEANLGFSQGLAFDKNDNLFITDIPNSRIRVINNETRVIKDIAGNGKWDYNREGDYPLSLNIGSPSDIFVDENDHIYFTDLHNHRVRKLTLNETLDVEDMELGSTISIYPNPAKDHLRIKIEKPAELVLFDLLGNEIMQTSIQKETKVPITFTSGVYVVKVSFDDQVIIKKIAVK